MPPTFKLHDIPPKESFLLRTAMTDSKDAIQMAQNTIAVLQVFSAHMGGGAKTVQDVLAEREASFAQSFTIISVNAGVQSVLKSLGRREAKRKSVHRKKVNARGGTRKRIQDSSFHSNLARRWFRNRVLAVNPQSYCSDLNVNLDKPLLRHSELWQIKIIILITY